MLGTKIYYGPDNLTGGSYLPCNIAIYCLLAAFSAVAIYMSVEIHVQIFTTFKAHRSLYFWSLLVCSWGIVVHIIASLLRLLVFESSWVFHTTLLEFGWIGMVTGFGLVQYSRLHLVIHNRRILHYVLAMIITNAFILHVPTAVLTYYANSPNNTVYWTPRFGIMERIQIILFAIQESIMALLYIRGTVKFLRRGYNSQTRKVMLDLIVICVIIMILDLVMIGVDFAYLYNIHVITQSFIYAVKLKLEFTILNQIMALARQGLPGSGRQPNTGSSIASTLHPSHTEKRRWDGTQIPVQCSDATESSETIWKTQDVDVSSDQRGSAMPMGQLPTPTAASAHLQGRKPQNEHSGDVPVNLAQGNVDGNRTTFPPASRTPGADVERGHARFDTFDFGTGQPAKLPQPNHTSISAAQDDSRRKRNRKSGLIIGDFAASSSDPRWGENEPRANLQLLSGRRTASVEDFKTGGWAGYLAEKVQQEQGLKAFEAAGAGDWTARD
ncbi:MAG: hypothetical protein M1833_000427 [Piccolia ochrophora]|nr:MAG: hypothetical protein M1833_000427 [Piccolia ochrophora]